MLNKTISWSLMPGLTWMSETREGTEDRTKSRVLRDAERVGAVTYCVKAWSPMKSSLCIRGAVEWLVTIGGSHFQSMSPQLKSPLITMFGWDFLLMSNTFSMDSERESIRDEGAEGGL